MKFAIIVFVLLIFFWSIWPTPYRYFPISDTEIHTTARVNRFTGNASLLGPNGWINMEQKNSITRNDGWMPVTAPKNNQVGHYFNPDANYALGTMSSSKNK